MVRIDARLADDDIDWDGDGDPGTIVTPPQDVNFSGSDLESYPAVGASSDWEMLDLRQLGSRRSPGGSYVDTDGTLALGPLSLLSGKGDAGKGDAGKGDAGKGDAGKGDAGKGDAGKGDAGGLSGKGDAGKGDAGGGDLFDSNDPDLNGGEMNAELAADLGVAAPIAFNAFVIEAPGTANHHDVQTTWRAPNEGNVLNFIVYRVTGTDVANDEAWTQVAVVPFVSGEAEYPAQAEYPAIDTTQLLNGTSYTYFAVATYPDLSTPLILNDVITSEPSRRVTIVGPNNPPTISNIADRSIPMGSNTGPVPFTIGDDEALTGVTVTGSSSNQALVPNANIVFGGSGVARTVTVSPLAGQSGTATITVTVTDSGGLSASDTFVLTVAGGATFFNVQNAPAVPPKSFKTGSAVPMKWQYKLGTTVVNSSALGHTVTVTGNGLNEVITNAAPGGSSFSYSSNTWHFNLKTTFGANLVNFPVGTYQVTVTPTGPAAAGFTGSTFTMVLVK